MLCSPRVAKSKLRFIYESLRIARICEDYGRSVVGVTTNNGVPNHLRFIQVQLSVGWQLSLILHYERKDIIEERGRVLT